jgi:DNA polymerase-3 subunit delta'
VLRLRSSSIEDVKQDLEGSGVDERKAHLAAHISGGRPGYARRLVQDDALLAVREERLNDLLALLSASRVEKFSYADKLARNKDAMRQAITFWLSYWRDVMLRTAQAEISLVNVDRNMEIEDLAGHMDLSTSRKVVGDLENALEKMDRNVNPRLLAEVLLLDLPKV